MLTIGVKTHSDKPAGLAGRLGLSLFFLIFAALGTLFTGFIVRTVWNEWQSRGWPETPCRIVQSSVARETKGDGDYQFQVRYEYRWEGRLLESTRWRLSQRTFADYGEARAMVERYPAGREAVCRVNPAEPTAAILESGSLWPAVFVFFPLIFVAIGVGGLFFTWRLSRARALAPAPISATAGNTRKNNWILVLFFGFFFLMGCAFLYVFLLRPALQVLAARSWTEVPCVVESSRVRSHSSSDGTTYSVDILYRYEFAGREHRANRYSFSTGSSSGRSGKQDVVNRHPRGHRTVCFVNPARPHEAVLHRGFTGMMWFGLIPLVFVFIGAGGMIFGFRSARSTGVIRDRATVATLRAGGDPTVAVDDSPRDLRPATSPAGKAVALLIFALFWNGIVSVFVYQIVMAFKRGRPEWFLTVFMIPFVLIGLGVIAAFVHAFMAVFNPRPRLTVAPGAGRLGGDVRVTWRFTGAVHRLERLRLTLEGRESATYRRGTDTTTDTSTFARVPLADTTERTAMHSGNASVRLPAEAVAPSFKSDNNKVEWFLLVRGAIARWPDVALEFPYELAPASPSPDAPAPVPAAADSEPERSATGHARLGVRGGRRVFRPGEVIEGVAGWSREQAPKLAEVRLIWFTRGKGTVDVAVVETAKLSPAEREAVQPFRFTLPDGPASFDGRLVAVQWALELVLEPGAESVRWEFALTPGGPPPVLDALSGERLDQGRPWYAPFRRQR